MIPNRNPIILLAFLAVAALPLPLRAEALSDPAPAWQSLLQDKGMAIEILSRAIRSGQFDRAALATAYSSRGNVYSRAGDHRRAIDDYDAAIGLDPFYAAAFYNRGIAFDLLGDPRQAVQDYSRAIDLRPDFAQAFYNRGRAHQLLADIGRAIDDYETAFRLAPEHPVIRNKMQDLKVLPWRHRDSSRAAVD